MSTGDLVINFAGESLYDPTTNVEFSRPPWMPTEEDRKAGRGYTSDDPLGIRLGGATKNGPSMDFITPIRAIANRMGEAKNPTEMQAVNYELRSLTRNMTTNLLMARANWMFEHLLDPSGRDLFRECGYPLAISPQMYREMYRRDGIATRVNDLLPEECWERPVEVYEDEDESTETPFESKWKEVNERHNLIHFMERIDRLSGIGSYGLMLLGIDDGKPLNEPIDGLDPDTGELAKTIPEHSLLYVRVFDESLCHVGRWNVNQQSPRYAQPDMYLIRFLDYTVVPIGQTVTDMVTHMVHWSRVVHIADNRTSSEVFGVPRMENVFNRLLDLRKLYGGSAEMFWKGGFPGIGLEVLPELADAEIDHAAVKEQMSEYQNSLKRYFAVAGMKIVTLNPNIEKPKEHIEAQLQAVSIAKGIPWRVFVGSEQAVKAGEQDSDAWDVRLQRRKTNYLSPMLVRPVVERLIAMGVVPPPEEQFHSDWPDASAPTMKDKAAIATSFAQALSVYITSDAQQLMAPIDFFVTVMGIERLTAEEIIENAKAYMEDLMAQQAEQMSGGLPSADDLSQAIGLDPQIADQVMEFITSAVQQAAQGTSGEETDTNAGQTKPGMSYQQQPAIKQEATGAISGGVSGGTGSQGVTGTPGGVPFRV